MRVATTIYQGKTMKLRAITLAAAGLLAAASAQAELQTWRFSGLLMSTEGTLSAPATFGEQAQLDLTFDLDAVATDGIFGSPLVALSINGASLAPGANSLAPDLPYFSVLNSALSGSETQGLTALRMKGGGGYDLAAGEARPVNSVSEFLFNTYQVIDGFSSMVFASEMTWQEAIQIEFVANGIPSIRLEHATGGAQLYALTGAQNITPGVPEPSSWALALLGGVGAAALARRRQSARQAEALAA